MLKLRNIENKLIASADIGNDLEIYSFFKAFTIEIIEIMPAIIAKNIDITFSTGTQQSSTEIIEIIRAVIPNVLLPLTSTEI